MCALWPPWPHLTMDTTYADATSLVDHVVPKTLHRNDHGTLHQVGEDLARWSSVVDHFAVLTKSGDGWCLAGTQPHGWKMNYEWRFWFIGTSQVNGPFSSRPCLMKPGGPQLIPPKGDPDPPVSNPITTPALRALNPPGKTSHVHLNAPSSKPTQMLQVWIFTYIYPINDPVL